MDTSQIEKAFGFDAPRHFANQIQILRSDNQLMSLMVFREVANVVIDEANPGQTTEIGRTVAGIIIPTDTVVGLRDILNTLFPVNAEKESDGESA